LHLLPRTPTQQVLTTSGYSSAAWTDGERLYVLIVPGDEKALQSFLRDAGAMA
jgi:anti-sigma factor RsiW